MRLDRLLAITMELLAKERLTATYLAHKFEVSIRTIYRDIELINQAGIPVASFTGADGGFEIMEGYYLTKQHFSLEDLSMLHMLLKAMEGSLGTAVESAIRKLSSMQPSLESSSQEAVVFNLGVSEQERNIIQQLYQAIRQSYVVELSYRDASGVLTKRAVKPLNLLWDKDNWYLEGHCELRRAKRMFRISRIEGFIVSQLKFTPHLIPEITQEKVGQEEVKGLSVHLRFSLSMSTRVFEQFSGEAEYLGDCIEVRTTFYSREYAWSVICSYGTNVIIVSPDELSEELITYIEAIRQHHLNNSRRESL